MPNKKNASSGKNYFDRFASWAAKATGSSFAFIGALIIVITWAATGPIFQYSETWQLVINTGTTIITFLMVFLIQKAQNKDSLATQLKLNELIAANKFTSNRLVYVEGLTEEDMEVLAKYYMKLAELAKKEENLHTSRSIDEAEDMHELKKNRRTQSTKEAAPRGRNNANHNRPASHAKPHATATKTNTTAEKSTDTEAASDKPKSTNRRRRPPRKGPPKTPAAE